MPRVPRSQFRMFEAQLLRSLEDPSMDLSHLLCPMEHGLRERMIREYYSLDSTVRLAGCWLHTRALLVHCQSQVLREFLGYQLAGLRRTMDSVAEKTGIALNRLVLCLSSFLPSFPPLFSYLLFLCLPQLCSSV